MWLHLLEKISPLICNIIRFCDVDGGLDLIEEGGGGAGGWQGSVFLDVLELTLSKKVGVGDDSNPYQASFPFSRYLIGEVEGYQANTMSASQLQLLIEGCRLSAVLNDLFCDSTQLQKFYIADFVALRFPSVRRPEAKEAFCNEIDKAARRELDARREEFEVVDADDVAMEEDGDNGDLSRGGGGSKFARFVTPADIQVAYSRLKPRLQFLASVLEYAPALGTDEVFGAVGDFDVTEFRADVAAFRLLVRHCEPKAEELAGEERLASWCLQVDRLIGFFHDFQSLQLPQGDVATVKDAIDRFQIVRLYLTHVCRPAKDRELRVVACNKLKRLNLEMKAKKSALKTGKGFKAIVNLLHLLNKDASKHHFGLEVDDCVICREDLYDPVILPCKHAGCARCLEEYYGSRGRERRQCPDMECKTEIPPNFRMSCARNDKNKVKKHQVFKETLGTFFLDILQRFVFAKSGAGSEEGIEQEVLESLLSFVITKELPKDDERGRTKRISPFAGHCIDSTPVVRSFILQLLLRDDPSTRSEYLNLFLDRERRFMRDAKQLSELCQLVMFCLEDALFDAERGGEFVANREALSLPAAHRLMLELGAAADLGGGAGLVPQLDYCAKARVALGTVAVLLNEVLGRKKVAHADQLLNSAAEFVCGSPMQGSLQRFFVRCLVALFRKDLVFEWKESGVLPELMPDEIKVSTYDEPQDSYLLLGGEYKKIKDTIRRALTVGRFDELAEMLAAAAPRDLSAHWSLALFYLLRVGSCPRGNLEALLAAVEQHAAGLAAATRAAVGVQGVFPAAQRLGDRAVFALVHHLRTALVHMRRENFLTAPLSHFAAGTVQGQLFLPTMPQDETMEVISALRGRQDGVTRWYTCSKGHKYGIGDCGQPVGRSKCPDCGEPIGAGNAHVRLEPRVVKCT